MSISSKITCDLPAFRVRGHVERRSFHTDPGAIVLYWHVAPQGLGPFVQECKTPKCVESLDSHRDVSTGRKPEILKKKIVKIM